MKLFNKMTETSGIENEEVLISQGAEARVYKIVYNGKPAIRKERFPKLYRHPDLEAKLTRQRFNQEVRCSAKAQKLGLLTPTVLHADDQTHSIIMEFVDGEPLRRYFCDIHEKQDDPTYEHRLQVCANLGRALAVLHNACITHGDLTTSNVMRRTLDEKIVLIDFGLAKSNASIEDKAVDIYVLERAFLSTHPGSEILFNEVYKYYLEGLKDADRDRVNSQFRKVQARGRKRTMVG